MFTLSFRALPALKAGALEAVISTASPVRGLRAVRAARFTTSKLPKPTICTFSPAVRDSVTVSVKAARTFSASFLERAAFSEIAFTSFIHSDILLIIVGVAEWEYSKTDRGCQCLKALLNREKANFYAFWKTQADVFTFFTGKADFLTVGRALTDRQEFP